MCLNKIVVLLPGNGLDYQGGGLSVALNLYENISKFISSEVFYYREGGELKDSLDRLVFSATPETVFLVTWGPDVGCLVDYLNKNEKKVIYFAQSTGWDIKLPREVPIICVSRHVMIYWSNRNPFNPLYILSPIVEVPFKENEINRDIDVLFVERKSTRYLKMELIPALEKKFNVMSVNAFIDRSALLNLFMRTKVYLYSSREHGQKGHQEGFGLQPLEAFLCGCRVFCNLHGGLADHMDPEVNMKQIEVHSLEYDIKRVSHVILNFSAQDEILMSQVSNRYSKDAYNNRLKVILNEICFFFSSIDSIEENCNVIIPVNNSGRLPKCKKWIKNKLKAAL